MNEVTSLSDDAALQAIGEQASKVNNMACQTVAEAARLGQMIADYRGEKPSLESLSRVITITGYGQAHIFRLIKLAKNWDAISDKKPESLRQALRMLEPPAPKPEPAPAPAPQPAPQPAPKPEAAPVRMTDEQANAAIEAAKVEANMSKSAGARFDAAVKKAVNIATTYLRQHFGEQVENEKKAIQAEREKFFEQLEPERERLKAAEEKAEREKTHYENYNVSPPTLLTEEEFKLIRGCLHADRVPADLKERFDKAFVAFNRLAQWYENADKAMQRRRSELIEMSHRWREASTDWERKERAKQEAAKAKVEKDAKEMEAKWGVKL